MKAIAILLIAATVIGGFIYVSLESRDRARDEPGAETPPGFSGEIPWVDLPYGFDSEGSGALAVGGGAVISEHATDGDGKAYRVLFDALRRDGLSCRPGALRTTLRADARLLVDFVNEGTPFPAILGLADARGSNPIFIQGVPVSPGKGTLEFSLAYVERELQGRGVRLPDVRTFRLGYGAPELGRALAFTVDNLRLGEGVLPEALAGAPIAVPPSTENFIPDGEFELGLAAWRLSGLPRSDSRAVIVTDERARDGGPSLALLYLAEGGTLLSSPDFVLEQGEYDISVALRGDPDVTFRIFREELREERWARVTSKGETAEVAPKSWNEIQRSFVIDSNGPAPRILRVQIELRGNGDVFIDSIRLAARDGRPAPAGAFDLGVEPVDRGPGGDGEPHVRLAWGEHGFVAGEAPVHPVLFACDDLPLDDEARLVSESASRAGFLTAYDFSAFFHGFPNHGGLATLAARMERRRSTDAALWLVTSSVAWPLAAELPGTVRDAALRLGEKDDRPVAVGVDLDVDVHTLYSLEGTADAVVVGGPLPLRPNATALDRLGDALAAAMRALRGGGNVTTPVLAQIDARGGEVMLSASAHLAWAHGVDGLVLNPFPRHSLSWRQRVPLNWAALARFASTAKERAARLAGSRPLTSGPRVAGSVVYRAFEAPDGGSVTVAVNLSDRKVADIAVEFGGETRKISLGAFEGRVIDR